MTADKLTKRWIRNEADERAVAAGCRFDEDRAGHILTFIEQHLRLYEGEYAGQSVRLMPWQIDVLSRIFGWVRFSKDWNRDVRRFRKASLWIPKKNGKSPTAAMVGLYLLVADGEQGQKVFSAAKDGKQAGIVHTHARQMVLQSDTLRDMCTINKTTGRITYEDTTSWYDILSGDNIQGQEGLNGSVIIDETHVVDDRLAKTLEYMGASRSEPLQFEVSTAGNNVDGYGKRQFDYGLAVNRGEIDDSAFFCEVFAAKQDATDDECGRVSTWKAANPSWGITIKEEEFRASHARARKKTVADWVTWKMYRLNIWSASANPWLTEDSWSRCADDFTEAMLRGRDCWVGLDLSKTRDMTAAVLVFPDDADGFWQLPYFWMPREEAEAKQHLAGFTTWARDGHLRLTAGNVLDYSAVEAEIHRLSRQFSIQKIVYDPTFAEELTQRLEYDAGIQRLAFPQSLTNLAPATENYERMILSATLRHNSHPVLSWQAGHVQVKEVNGRKLPVKPKRGDIKKIDGIMAGMMALQVAITESADRGSTYDDRGILTI